MGLWLRASIMRDKELARQLGRQLNGGKHGWNKDEAGVAQAVCNLAADLYFGQDYDVRAITETVSTLRQATLKNSNSTTHGQLEMEAVIRHALGEVDVDIKGINAKVAFEIQVSVTVFFIWQLGFTEAQVDELIGKAEQAAFDRGWNPPLAA
jgi:hypothetical protein